jgi:hypothetical protein
MRVLNLPWIQMRFRRVIIREYVISAGLPRLKQNDMKTSNGVPFSAGSWAVRAIHGNR